MHAISRVLLGTAATGLLLGSIALPVDAATYTSYKNCTELNKVYQHGVGKSGAKDKSSASKKVTNFKVSTGLYNVNNGPHQAGSSKDYDLDRDNDGIACEKF